MEELNVMVERDVKQGAESLFSDMGIDSTIAVNLFFRKCLLQGGLPFEIQGLLHDEGYKPRHSKH